MGASEDKIWFDKIVIAHDNKFKRYLDILMIWAVLVSCLISSYWLGFDEPSTLFFNVTRIIESFFYIDFALNFISAIKNPITLIVTNDLF